MLIPVGYKTRISFEGINLDLYQVKWHRHRIEGISVKAVSFFKTPLETMDQIGDPVSRVIYELLYLILYSNTFQSFYNPFFVVSIQTRYLCMFL